MNSQLEIDRSRCLPIAEDFHSLQRRRTLDWYTHALYPARWMYGRYSVIATRT